MISKKEWILELVRDNKIIDTGILSPDQILTWLDEYNQFFGGMCTAESFKRKLRGGKQTYLLELSGNDEYDYDEEEYEEQTEATYPDQEIIEANVRFQKQKQKFQDSNRIERKSFREYARVENAVSEYAQELVKILKEQGEQLTKYEMPFTFVPKDDPEVGMIQITDTHFNELIDLPHNTYDMRVASHRLWKLCYEAHQMFSARGVEKVVVAFTGDLMNSDRRLDELLNQATNRAKATFVAVDLIRKFLYTLAHNFSVSVVSVLGNESRVNKEMSFSNEALSDNYDFTILNMVRIVMEAAKVQNITFGSLDEVETIIEIKGQKVLLTHDVPKSTASQKGTQSVIGMKYLQGNPIDCMIAGHLHSTNNQMYGYRSSALCGSNSYSDNALHLAGRAGQNIYFFGEGYRHVMSIDLQNYNEGEWFDIDETLMEYNAKSVDKTRKRENIMSIVI